MSANIQKKLINNSIKKYNTSFANVYYKQELIQI